MEQFQGRKMNHPKLGGGKILRSGDPVNLEMPFEKLESFITRVELFMPPILIPGSGFYEPANMCDKWFGFKSPQQTNQQTNNLGL